MWNQWIIVDFRTLLYPSRKKSFFGGVMNSKQHFFALKQWHFRKDSNGYWYFFADWILATWSTISDFRTIANLVFSTAILIVPLLSHPTKFSLLTKEAYPFLQFLWTSIGKIWGMILKAAPKLIKVFFLNPRPDEIIFRQLRFWYFPQLIQRRQGKFCLIS